MADATLWDDLFGAGRSSPTVAVTAVQEALKVARRSAEMAEAEALRAFLDASGQPIAVPPPPRAGLPLPPQPDLVWPDCPPVFWGPIAVVRLAHMGGGRGIVACRDLSPGEVLLIEEPVVKWSASSSRRPRQLLSAALRRPDAHSCLRAMARLHPEVLEGVDGLDALREEHMPTVSALLPLYCEVVSQATASTATPASGAEPRKHDGTGGAASASGPWLAAANELLRLCLVCQWNAFDSGLFLHQALINHAAPRNANCDKAWLDEAWRERWKARGEGGGAAACGGSDGGSGAPQGTHGASVTGGVSVVRATRRIQSGEEITISYLQPMEVTASRAASRLRQFDFCDAVAHDPELDAAPSSDGGGSGIAEQSSAALLAWEEAAEARLRCVVRAPSSSLRWLAEAIGAAIASAAEEVGPRHLAVAALRRQAADALRSRLSSGGGAGGSCGTAAGEEDGRGAALLELLRCSLELWHTQSRLLGPFHPECAISLHDVGASLGRLLASSAADRAALGRAFPSWAEPRLASLAEGHGLALHAAISALYP